MKALVATVLFALCLTPSVRAQAQASEHGEFWIPKKVHWKHVKGEPKHQSIAPAVVFYFAKGERFVRDECWLVKDRNAIAISNGDPHNEYVGQIMQPMLDGQRLQYRLVRRTVQKAGEKVPGDWISENSSVLANSGLSIGNRYSFFRHVVPANANEYEARYAALLAKNF